MSAPHTLTVFCPLGLGNRLRVLLSGLVLAEATGRNFQMLWPVTPACAAPFADLFAAGWPVTTVPPEAVAELPYVSGWLGHLPDLLTAAAPHLVVGHPSWLLRPDQYPQHAELMAHCARHFASLAPIPPLQTRIDTFRAAHFRPTMIGVHLRRGDLLRERPDMAGNTAQALAAVDRFLTAAPDAGILLCTDDGAPDPHAGRATPTEGVRATFVRRYGPRVVTPTPRSLDRSSVWAVQDALVDLALLRACDQFVGTAGSSFSEMVVFGRDLPHLLTGGATPAYARLEHWARRVGLHPLLSRLGMRRFGRALPFPVLLNYYLHAPRRGLRRLLRRT